MSRKWGLLLVLMLVSATFTILVPTHSRATEPTRVYVDPLSVVDPPTFFNVSVKVDNVQNLAGVQLTLSWDPTLLYGINMTDVIFHQVTPQSEWDNIWRIQHEIDNVVGEARYGYTFVSMDRAIAGGYFPISGNFTVFVIEFQVRMIGNCTLHFSTSKLGGPMGSVIIHDTIDGFFSNSISPPSIPPSPPGDAVVSLYVEPRAVKNESLAINSTFSITVKLDSIANHSGFVYVDFLLDWNTTLLEYVGLTDIMFHQVLPEKDWGLIDTEIIGPVKGELLFSTNMLRAAFGAGYRPVFGNFTVAVVTFRVISVGKCPLYLHDSRVYNLQESLLFYTIKGGYFSNAMTGDLNGDLVVDLFDALLFAKSFGARPELQSWNEDADINGDGVVDIYDAIALCNCFGHTR